MASDFLYLFPVINMCSVFYHITLLIISVIVISDSAGLLQFEVCPLTDSSFSVSFQHPVNESLVCGKHILLLFFLGGFGE